MGVRIEVPAGVVRAARLAWEVAAGELDEVWRGLHAVPTTGLSPSVAGVLETFREGWVDRIKAAHRTAEGFEHALDLTDDDLTVTDLAQAELLRGLLPWAYRAADLRRV